MASQTPRTTLNSKEFPTDTHTQTQPGAEVASYHPDFSAEDADIVLRSQDEVLFRVHSLILKISSGWFRALFTLPQSSSAVSRASSSPSPSKEEVIPVGERSEVLATLLSVANGKPLPRLDSIDFIDELLQTVEKYDMPGAASVVRLGLSSVPLVQAHPIRVYAIACRWGWKEEAKIASSYTLHLDLLSSPTMSELYRVHSADLTRLLALHRRRRDRFRQGLDSEDLFYANLVPGKCASCDTDTPHSRWHNLKYEWVTTLEESPINVASRDLLERPELLDVLDSKCQKCQKKLYNAESTLANIRTILDELPTTVEL